MRVEGWGSKEKTREGLVVVELSVNKMFFTSFISFLFHFYFIISLFHYLGIFSHGSLINSCSDNRNPALCTSLRLNKDCFYTWPPLFTKSITEGGEKRQQNHKKTPINILYTIVSPFSTWERGKWGGGGGGLVVRGNIAKRYDFY